MKTLVAITRSGYIESLHRGAFCVVDKGGRVIYHVGNPHQLIFIRSTAKPFQALALVNSGAMEHYDISLEELAIACGSHSGQPFHHQRVHAMLKKVGLGEEHLACGATHPFNLEERRRLIANGEAPRPVHNGCSGKHAAMLILCRYYDFPITGYTEATHPVQRVILKTLATLLGIREGEIGLGVDGCDVPTYRLSLYQLAQLFCALAQGKAYGGPFSGSLERIKRAMLTYPEMVNGEEEFCTCLMRESHGRILGKIGGEGVYGVALPEEQLGVALTVEDGHERAVYPGVMGVLKSLQVLEPELLHRLRKWAYPPVKNHVGRIVGHGLPVFQMDLPKPLKVGDPIPWRLKGIKTAPGELGLHLEDGKDTLK